jgi:hypothetical protein
VADFTVRYADFKGGDYGIRDPAKADADTYAGHNVYPYESGLLGVRAGLRVIPVTGLPDHPTVPGPLGFWAFGDQLVVVLGQPYAFPMAGGAAVAWQPWGASPTGPVRFVSANNIPYSLVGGTLYKHANPTGAAPTVVVTPSPLSHIVRWGYYFVAIDAVRPWRIWFSTVDASGPNYDSWGANSYIDIGNQEPITSLNPIFNTLYVGKQTGWSAISGVLGTLASNREVVIGNGPIDPRTTTVTTDNRILYWPTEASPAWFNGERVSVESTQKLEGRSLPFPCDTVIVSPTGKRIVLASEDPVLRVTNVLSWASSAWSRSTFPARLGGLVPSDVRDGVRMPEDVVFAALGPATVGDPVYVCAYHHQLNRPGHVTDPHSSPFDVSVGVPPNLIAGSVSFPSYWEPIGRQVRVRSIIVQFRKWASGVAEASNEIDLRIDAAGRYSGGDLTGRRHEWIEPCERASRDGEDDSWRVNVGEQGYGNGFRLSFTKLVGVALREVIVLCDVRTERT